MLWAEGGTPEVEIVIETVDNELLALRKALNSKEPRRYQDFLAPHAGGPHGPMTTDGADGPRGPYDHGDDEMILDFDEARGPRGRRD